MPKTLTGEFTDCFGDWLASEGFWVSQKRDSACANMIDFSGCQWVISVRATTLHAWTLVVVFDPAGDAEELFHDLDATPEQVIHVLAAQLHEVWDEAPLV